MREGQEIPLSQPDITDLEIEYVTKTLRSGRLSIGPEQEAFEARMADLCDCAEGIAVSSGTAGLHLALLALGVGPGDEVITTPFSFIASANCILYTGATPVFVDIHPRSLNLDPSKLESAITPRTKAIIAVETFGNPCHIDEIVEIANRNEIPVVEDACEGLGGKLSGRPVGNFGRLAVFGFYPNKQITTGEGGMIVTNDERLATLCRSMRNQGRTVGGEGAPELGVWLTHERLGFNYRLSELHAALGLAQLRRLPDLLERRREVASRYINRLLGHPDIILPTIDGRTEMSWFVFVVRLSNEFSQDERDRIITGLRRHEVGAAAYFPAIHTQPFYRERFGMTEGTFPIAESVSHRTIALPFYGTLTKSEIDLVCQTLELMIQRETFSRR